MTNMSTDNTNKNWSAGLHFIMAYGAQKFVAESAKYSVNDGMHLKS